MTITKSIRLKENLLKQAENKANDLGYHNITEYIRNLIIQDLRKAN